MNGYNSEGIFRLAPNENDVYNVKNALNAGTFTLNQCNDVNCIANLIKVALKLKF